MKKENKLDIPGKIRGAVFKEDFDYIEEYEGKTGLSKLKEALIISGYGEIFNTDIKTFEWYPLEWHVFILLKSKEIFNWTDDDVVDFGYKVTKMTIFLKLYLKYFFSAEKAISKANEYWQQIYSLGDVTVVKADLQNRIVIFKITNFKTNRILCLVIRGYLKSVGEMILGKKENMQICEKKCELNGDPCHEFSIEWD
jgi:hypothetical protein